ncbi:cold-shock protein [Corallococcus terminator]|uniref:Cold-shock protein n=1 Tax=Corallococcus terminator TaxID=2316733 RepID=A0A3A8J7Z5_9BACT|nr:cold shock domain-containing protein [Corallococcus terminator]RKG91779.1 cold-shock protein [Corallococcus terminator]
MRRRTGIVQWFNLAMGFGFIAPDRGGRAHVVVLREDIEADGDPVLTRGQAVSFEYFTGRQGPRAIHVRPLESSLAADD